MKIVYLVSTQRNEELIDRYIVRNLTSTGFYQIDNQYHVPTLLWNTTVDCILGFNTETRVLRTQCDGVAQQCTLKY